YFKPGEKGTGEHLTDTQRDEALQFLAGCNADQPFLLQVYTKAAHCQDGDAWQYQPAPRYKTLYEDVTYPRPVTATETDFQAQPLFLQTSEAHNRWKLRFTEELFQPTVRDYFRLVQGIDDLAGALTARLKEQGLAENTVFIFTSDNGHYLGEHGLAGKWFMHEESIRVPLFISDPRVATGARGQNRQEFALTIDIAPTIFDLAGVAPSPGLQGRSLAPIVRGEQPANWRPEYYYEHRFVHPHIAQTEGIRTARWKYARYISETPVYEELFDLAADPYERKNLANQPESTAVLAELRQKTDAAYAEIK
ncbi:MAG TPA: sulfatase/phosphatase domain-containing protein, partial [Planctomycetaceae bacterium]|nr:sulfatase/phosphatase domain-containing protein [Planctomycetaceae bacterium]